VTDIDFANRSANEPPQAEAGGPYSVPEGGTVILDASGTSDPDQPPTTLIYGWDLDGDGVFGETGADAARGDETGISPTFRAGGLDGPTLIVVALRVTDNHGVDNADTATINVENVAPNVAADSPTVTVDEGQTATNTGAWSDPGADEVTLAASAGTVTKNGNGTWTWTLTNAALDDTGQVTITANDDDGAQTSTTFQFYVNPVLVLPAGKGTNKVVVSRNGGNLLVVLNKKTELLNRDVTKLSKVTIQGVDDKVDHVTIDFAGGAIALADGIVFDGGSDEKKADTLTLLGTAADDTFELDTDSAAINGLGVQFSDVEQLTLDGSKAGGKDTYKIFDLSTKTILASGKGAETLDFSDATVGVGVAIDLSRNGG
jgi:hypothetical protein